MKENNGVHLEEAMSRTHCKRHNALPGDPCWTMMSNIKGVESLYRAICGRRIRLAGFVGTITATAMSKKPSSYNRKNKG